ncbi:MAG: Eco57I restriction-modification methylase domain-containing protein, partial [Anaerolineae bacterium]|nr:Eco57I restriction-modification methylase domain-containing protein [Anaerolineae bacterium]
GKKEEIVPASEAEKPGFAEKTRFLERFPAGQVYLVTDRGERKATGSYYTPDYIVKYIVEQTLGPLADSQAEAVEKEITALKAKNKGGARSTQAYKDELSRLQNSFADRILDLNTLDPAMGSGHFLVEATNYLARRIVEAGVVTEALASGSTEPVLPPRVLVAVSGAEGLTGAGDEESELSYWRRRVVERCIYGVDLNPLAVELAKLSLWLATVARGKPLSFLDHHLRCGNSLIGARVADLRALPVRKKRRRKARKTSEVSETSEVSQLAMWDESAFTQDMYLVVGAMRQIQEYETADLVSVKEKERLFEETVERERRKWRTIADLWTATYFGLELTPQLYNACAQYVQGQPVLLQAAQAEALLDQAHEIWGDKRFFHWEIEFPEVFFDEYGRHKGETAGFDAVVGNPPWISFGLRGVGKLDTQEEVFYRLVYQHSAEYKLSIYAVFMERAITLLRVDGRHSYIVPDSFLLGQYFSKIRNLILRTSVVDRIVLILEDFWPAGSIGRSVVYVLQSAKPGDKNSENEVRVILADTLQSFRQDLTVENQYGQGLFERAHLNRFRLFFDDTVKRIVKNMESGAELLSNVVKFYSGLIGKAGKASIVVKGQPSDYSPDRYGRLIESGANLDRYSLVFADHYIRREKRLYKSGYDVQKYLNPKMFLNQTGDSLKACFDAEGYFCLNNMHIGYPVTDRYDLRYINALLCSRLLGFYYHSISLESGRAMAQTDIETIDRLPIRRIPFTTPPEERERLVEEALDHEQHEMARKARNAKGDFVPFADFRQFRDPDSSLGRWVDARLSAKPEQADVVHDLLAHLAERMIEMHKEKQAEVRGFLDWLAEYTGRTIDEWALKTNLRRYYEQDWAEMGRILKRNQRKLPQVDLDVEAYKNEPAARIRAAWETSMET